MTSVLILYNQPLLPTSHPEARSEHAVVETAQEVGAILDRAGFRCRLFGLGGDPTALWTELKRRRPDLVFNLYEGTLQDADSEACVAGLLQWSGLPFTGSPSSALSLSRYKDRTKRLLRGARLPTAEFFLVHALPAPRCPLPFPVIVKPAAQDASIGVDQASVCVDQRRLKRRVRYILETYGPPALVEKYIPGREFHVFVIELPTLETLIPSEIIFPSQKRDAWPIYTYAAKWTPDTLEFQETQAILGTDLPVPTRRKLSRLAQQAHRELGCRDYSRVDFRLMDSGKACILEVNPNPDICEQADLTACLSSVGMSHAQFITRLAHEALRRGQTLKASTHR